MKYKEILNKCDALVILSKSNLFYFSGYENEDAIIVITAGHKLYITDDRYSEEVAQNVKGFKIIRIENGSLFDKLKDVLTDEIKIIGFEENEISYLNHKKLESLNKTLIPISEDVNALRLIKREDELIKISEAQLITDTVFTEIIDFIKIGMTEIELASKLESLIFEKGAEGLAFSSIVAFGKNTSKPHAHRTKNTLKNGDFITLDFGAKLNGYCSDMTRTIGIGKLTSKQIEVYNAVLEAQKIALQNIKAGILTSEADAFSRYYFKSLDYDNYFTHSLGHGIGIEVHESPRMSRFTKDILLENMVVSVEPGLYFPNEFGVRIEDMVVLKNNGLFNLTKSDKKLIIL